MRTELKDVIHFYLGCKVFIPKSGKKGTLVGIDRNKGVLLFNIHYSAVDDYITMDELTSIRPVLRSLFSMTNDEELNIFGVVRKYGCWKGSPSELLFTSIEFSDLVKMGFDLFGLIDSNQAIEKLQ